MSWYVSQIETNKERTAERLAPSFGIKAFLPLIEQKFTASGRVMKRPVLMFPGYLFLNFTNLDLWKRARREGFVFLNLLGAGAERVQTVADAIVDELKARHVNGVVPVVDVAKPVLKVGQPIIIERGQYANFRGLVQEASEQRVKVLLTLFNRSFDVSLNVNAVRAA